MLDTDARELVRLVPNAGWDPRVHVVRCGEIVDATFVVTERYVVLVDTLINPATADALVELAAPHLTDGRTLLVVNTHADWDHCWGNQRFAGAGAGYPAPILGHRIAAERLGAPEAAAELAALRAKRPVRFAEVALMPPTICFDGPLAIDGGDLRLQLVATPGHQPDHVSVWLPEIRTLLAGDAAEWPFPFAMSPAALPLLRHSLAKLAALAPAVALYCHAPETSGPALLAQNVAYFDRLEAACRTALAHGLTAEAARAEGADPERLVDLPYPAALPPGADADALPAFYRDGHRQHIGHMLAWLES